MQLKKRILLLLLFSMFASFGHAQKQHLVSGTVVDASEEPLVGVAVLLKGKNKGVQTDFDGKFSLKATADDVLVFQYVGMKTQEVSLRGLDGAKTLSIVLQESQAELEEVVISTGYQKKSVETLTGSVVTIDERTIQNRPATSLTHLLQGVAPGLLVNRSNPGRIGGGGVSISSQGGGFRGAGGMLIVVDDFQQTPDFSLGSINPNDVKSLHILRGPETVVYGPQGANGVIVIETKSGGKPKIDVNTMLTYKAPNIWFRNQDLVQYGLGMDEAWKLQNASGFVGWANLVKYLKDNKVTSEQLRENTGKPLSQIPMAEGPWPNVYGSHMMNIDWIELMYKPIMNYQNDVAIQGQIKHVERPERIRYRASLRRNKESTMMRYGENHLTRIFGSVQLDVTYRPWIAIGTNINTRFDRAVNPSNLGDAETLIMRRMGWQAAFDEEGNPLRWGGFRSPVTMLQSGNTWDRSNMSRTQLYLNLKPIKGLQIRLQTQANYQQGKSLGITTKSYDYQFRKGKKSLKTPYSANTNVRRSMYAIRSVLARASVNYTTFLVGRTHQITAFASYNHEERDREGFNVGRRNVLSERIPALDLSDTKDQTSSDWATQNVVTSLIANVQYSFKKRYIADFIFNRNGASNFAKGYKFSNFYTLAAAWNIHNEPLFRKVTGNLFQELKLRYAHTSSANNGGIGLYDFSQDVNVRQSNILFGTPGSYSRTQVATFGNPSSDERTWALTKNRNIGINFKMFGNRLIFMGDLYRKTTDNAFYTEQSSAVFGARMPQINGASFENNGWDFQITWKDKLGGLAYDITFMLSDNVMKTVKLSDNPNIRYGINTWMAGENLNTVYGYQFDGIMKTKDQADGYKGKFTAGLPADSNFGVGDAMYRDMDGDGELEPRPYKVDSKTGKPTADSGDLIRLKDTNQRYYYNLNLGLSYKGFGLSVLLNGVGRWYVYDTSRHIDYGLPWNQRDKYTYQTGFHPTKRPNLDTPRYITTTSASWAVPLAQWNYRYSNGAHVQKNVAYLAVQRVMLSYNLPKKVLGNIGLSRFEIFTNVANPGYLINNVSKSFSPEQPFQYRLAPYPVNYSFGVNISL